MKTNKLKSIEIVCENCEVYKIDWVYVLGLSFEDVTKRLYVDTLSKEIYRVYQSNDVFLKLVINEYETSWESIDKEFKNDFSFSDRMIRFRDITKICLNYENDLTEEYEVYYEEENTMELGSPNKYQKAEIDELENVIKIEIRKPLTE